MANVTNPYRLPEGELSGYTLQVVNDIEFPIPHTFVVITGPDGVPHAYGFAPAAKQVAEWPGVISDNDGHPETSRGDVIPITADQYQNVSSFINNSIDNPPYYNLFKGQVCTAWVAQLLISGGVDTRIVSPDLQDTSESNNFIQLLANNPWTERFIQDEDSLSKYFTGQISAISQYAGSFFEGLFSSDYGKSYYFQNGTRVTIGSDNDGSEYNGAVKYYGSDGTLLSSLDYHKHSDGSANSVISNDITGIELLENYNSSGSVTKTQLINNNVNQNQEEIIDISPNGASISESSGEYVFTLTRYGDVSQPTALYVSTTDASTVAGESPNTGAFSPFIYQPVSFAAGSSTAQVGVEINDLGISDGSANTYGVQATSDQSDSNILATSQFSIINDDPSSSTYVYTGNPFNYQPNSKLPFFNGNLTASFKFSGLSDNFSGEVSSESNSGPIIADWSVSSYGETISKNNNGGTIPTTEQFVFEFQNGNIVNWGINVIGTGANGHVFDYDSGQLQISNSVVNQSKFDFVDLPNMNWESAATAPGIWSKHT